MYSKEFPLITEPVEELTERLKRERNARLRTRLHLLVLIRSGQVASRREAAEHLAVHRNSVTNWLRLYEQGGMEAFLRIGVGGPRAEQKTLPDDVFRALSERVAADAFPSYVAAQEWLRDEHDLNVSYRTLHSIIRYRLGAKLKRRHSVDAKQW
jgi:transposase